VPPSQDELVGQFNNLRLWAKRARIRVHHLEIMHEIIAVLSLRSAAQGLLGGGIRLRDISEASRPILGEPARLLHVTVLTGWVWQGAVDQPAGHPPGMLPREGDGPPPDGAAEVSDCMGDACHGACTW
jgi:hypothetical protein